MDNNTQKNKTPEKAPEIADDADILHTAGGEMPDPDRKLHIVKNENEEDDEEISDDGRDNDDESAA